MESDNDVFTTNKSEDITLTPTSTQTTTSSVPNVINTKPKFEFNGVSIVLCVVVVILIAIIVYLIVKKPKINNELLTKTQEMYKDSAKKNKELSQALDEVNKKNKVLESTNENIMKNNSALKDQLTDVQNKYSDIQGELNGYKTREAQELELKTATRGKTKNEMFKEQYAMINKPNPEHVKQEVQPVQDSLSDTGEISLDTTGIAAQQNTIKQQMANLIEQPNNDLESVMATLNN